MCGIAGWFCHGDSRPSGEIVRGLLLANLERGTSAAGVAWRDGDKIRVRKHEGPADKFIQAQGKAFFEKIAASPIGLLHARATTKGSEKDNENNHPVVGFEWVVTHNGTITNDDDLWGYYEKAAKTERFADVDTSVLPLVLSRSAKIEESIQNLSLVSGSATLAAWHGDDIERVVLARFGHHDLLLFYDEKTKIMYWSSAGGASYVMSGPIIGRHKFVNTAKLADEHAMLLSPEGPSHTRVFKVSRRPFFVPFKKAEPPKSDSTPKAAAQPSSSHLGDPVSSVHGGRRMVIPVKLGHSERKLDITWRPMEQASNRPWPMNEVFSTKWWSLPKIIDALKVQKEDSLVMGAAYGLWTFNKPTGIGAPYTWKFKPYKRTKEWMQQDYRNQFAMPFELEEEDGKQYTVVDSHWAWEHYDLNILMNDNSTKRLLGFMCPWCGAWQSSTQVAHNHNRCEFCHAANRMTEASNAAV